MRTSLWIPKVLILVTLKSSNSIRFQLALGIDANVISSLAHVIWNEHYQSILSQEQIDYMLKHLQSASAIKSAIDTNTLDYYLVYEADEIIGYIALGIESDALLLSKCYLLKNTRQKGYFREIISFMEEISNEHHLETLKLFVNKYNSSLHVYQHCGFKIVDSHQFDIGGGYIMDDYEMIKERGQSKIWE